MLLVKPELVRDGMEAPMHIEHSSPQINRLACQVELRPAREFTDTQRYNWYMQQMANQLKQQLADSIVETITIREEEYAHLRRNVLRADIGIVRLG